MVEAPQSFMVREECEKVAFHNGFRRVLGEEKGWRAFASTTAFGVVYLAADSVHGQWFLALEHSGVVAELGMTACSVPGPGITRYALSTLGQLYVALNRVYELSISLPDAPLQEFEHRIANLPRSTEAERLVVQRVGQDVFRARLLDYWHGACPLTGISDPSLLRASHIIPWAQCESDAERLNVHNGLLLSALWDAAFDHALITFDDEGQPHFSLKLSENARAELRWQIPISLTEGHRRRLVHHRLRYQQLKDAVAESAITLPPT